ncbi:N-acetylneuraminate synthase [Legionella hackeliae]|uniref:Sialic acid synthase n=1 Tax=Legionella hackeliae TaxID=449 RepID=A0A0A8UMX8_LEGHA|nr:N-acetylneuraminate synthase [Legionella hackeliae]KTD08792.1 N-acetylneuraminic acid synthetase [Legionella hackeliae]CEK10220.1 Sialic acid synthase [Legionella hackeliae]STX46949.1 N-acetylneuraminic acid synthetase [Legionella hackeliae]
MSITNIIAEAGVNHNGNENLAFKLVEVASAAGADIVKFQTFKAKQLVAAHAKLANYQQANTRKNEPQLAMLSRLELSYEAHKRLVAYCSQIGIEFLSSAFDFESLNFLVDDLKLRKLKIPSGEITNAPFVLEHARTGCNLILSTGMATLAEVEAALGVIAFGYTRPKTAQPSQRAFQEAYFSETGQQVLREKVILLHCTTEYPAPFDDVNLRAMDTMRAAFNLPIGYSDHTEGIVVPIAAVARGAVLIEKHFTLDKTMDGPDHKASLDPKELQEMVHAIRITERTLGNGIKGPRPSELGNKDIARKSLVAKASIKKGEILNSENMGILRPGDGLSPYQYWSFLGKEASHDYEEGELLR